MFIIDDIQRTAAAVVIGLAVGAGGGAWLTYKVMKANQVDAVKEVRHEDGQVQSLAHQSDVRRVDLDIAQRNKSNATIASLHQKLSQMGECVVPGDVVGLLNDATRPADTGPAGESRPSQPAADPPRDSTAKAELEVAARNYTEVCIPNAQDRDELRRLYNDVKDRINSRSQ